MSDSEHKHISEPEARRLEIFTGAGRRRRWSRETKARIVAESYGECTTVSEVARRHGLTVPQLFAWRRQLRPAVSRVEQQLAFAPVVVDQDGGAEAERQIIVELCGAVVRVPAGVSAASVAAVLRALRSSS
jgi:transposase